MLNELPGPMKANILHTPVYFIGSMTVLLSVKLKLNPVLSMLLVNINNATESIIDLKSVN